MAKTKKRHSRGGSTIPVAVVAGFIPYATTLFEAVSGGTPGNVMKVAPKLIGYDGFTRTWSWNWMQQAGTPAIFGGLIVHTLASRLGINRALARAKIPFFRV